MNRKIIIAILLLSFCLGLSAQSKGSLLLRSLILPGWGQVKSGHNYGYAMMATEIGIISTLFYCENEHDLKRKEAYEFAVKYAGLYPGTYSDEFLGHLSRYRNSGFGAGGYNAMVREQALALYPGQPDLQQQYIDNNAYSDDMSWSWSEDYYRKEFGNIRGDMNNFKESAQIVVGILVLNHLVSAIDVLRVQSEQNRAKVNVGILRKDPALFLQYKF